MKASAKKKKSNDTEPITKTVVNYIVSNSEKKKKKSTGGNIGKPLKGHSKETLNKLEDNARKLAIADSCKI